MKNKTFTALAGAAGIVCLVAGGQAIAQGDDEFAAMMAEGEVVFYQTANCASCHGQQGEGGFGPELAGNDYLAGIGGLLGMILGGFEEHGMPAFADRLSNREVAAVATFVRNSFGNNYNDPLVMQEAWVQTRRTAE